MDYLRGFALLGIILMNIIFLLEVRVPVSHSIDSAYQRFLYFFIEGRFYPIFAFLFGVGFYLFTSRANAKGKNGTLLFLRRVSWMFILGIIHTFFHPGEALTVYAVCGLIVLPFYKWKKEINLLLGLALLILFSVLAIKILLPLPIIILGLTAGQYRIFERISLNTRKIALFTLLMFVLSILGLIYQLQFLPLKPFDGGHFSREVDMDSISRFLHIGIMIGPVVSGFYIGMLMLLLQLPSFQKILLPLKSYGRMSLTNYLMQTALILVSGHIFNLVGTITYIHTLYLCLLIYVVQLLFSVFWFRYFCFGPFEWLWRLLTYFEVSPLKRTKKS